MGNICGKDGIPKFEYSDFCPLRIATLYADIDESINKKKKIETIVEYFMKPYHGYYIDVLCIQGIRNPRILKEIVSTFKKHIEQYNDDHRSGYNKSIYLEYFPDVGVPSNHENDLYWSTSESENEIEYYDKLIISRHSILQSADIQIGSDRREINKQINASTFKNDAKLMINNTDSDEVSNVYKYVQIVNLNVDGTFVSVYNVDLEDDSIGISNNKERRKQIQDLREIVEINRQRSIVDEVRQFVHGDNTFIACNRDIHIVTGVFHINEIKNGSVSSEYNRMCATLNGFDTHRWIASLRKNTENSTTNVRFTKDTYTMLVSKNLTTHPDQNSRSQKLFEEHKVVVINSNIAKNIVDMNQFTNYPEDTIFMLYRPNIELVDRRRMFANGRKKKDILADNTRFMDLMTSTVANRVESINQHPKYGTVLNGSSRNVVTQGVSNQGNTDKGRSDKSNTKIITTTDSHASRPNPLNVKRSKQVIPVTSNTTNMSNMSSASKVISQTISQAIAHKQKSGNTVPQVSQTTDAIEMDDFKTKNLLRNQHDKSSPVRVKKVTQESESTVTDNSPTDNNPVDVVEINDNSENMVNMTNSLHSDESDDNSDDETVRELESMVERQTAKTLIRTSPKAGTIKTH
ncbi:hypothetical protein YASMINEVIRUS_884 [Yasminevirus sp. GU-2018]|uniref:Uncharacterized protein n=1 Tax=Yasminevirus sp. GU-2018 TaxID=2420051 RepID=A0A5K0U9Z7_9VIRU|nr:hypothetical protein YASMINEVIRUS_884 [Yasminevirus sp. GU-2018]